MATAIALDPARPTERGTVVRHPIRTPVRSTRPRAVRWSSSTASDALAIRCSSPWPWAHTDVRHSSSDGQAAGAPGPSIVTPDDSDAVTSAANAGTTVASTAPP
ncbi:unannotated protein [freshwater metagenome]|uniref:Unannotated protein n=1 Tax=freshwater metagenome TaxID=449393 RepID=A0A6J6BXL4_9ZZZZ